jgi:hypothetical protein
MAPQISLDGCPEDEVRFRPRSTSEGKSEEGRGEEGMREAGPIWRVH